MLDILTILAGLLVSPAQAQTCPTRPPGDSSNACASTAFVKAGGRSLPFVGVTSQWPWQLNADGTWTTKQPACADLATASPSCSTDTTNPANINFTQSGTGAVAYNVNSKIKQVVSVSDFGALCNSNGTHGSGNDDTASIQAAMNYAGLTGAELIFPRGVCRTTATLNASTTNYVYRLKGAGYGAQLFNDSASPVPTITANASSYSGGSCPISLQPCVSVEGITFIAPYTTSAGNYAVRASYNQHLRFVGNSVQGYRVGLNFDNSYAPEIIGNTFTNNIGNAVFLAADSTGNRAQIVANRLYANGAGTSDAAVSVGGSVTSLTFTGNDIESNYGGVIFGDISGSVISGNFIDVSSAFNIYFTTTASGLTIVGNNFGGSAATTLDISNSTVANNSGSGWAVTWSAASTGNVAYNNPTGWATPPGAIGLAGGLLSGQALSLAAPSVKTASYAVDSGATKDTSVAFACTASCTVTLPNASVYPGRRLRFVTRAAFTVVRASSNVIPITGGSAGIAILPATAGKWAELESDGTDWLITASN